MNKIAIIGLGYVGLPLAIEFSKIYPTIGYDIDVDRIKELEAFIDSTEEVSQDELVKVLQDESLRLTSNVEVIKDCNIFIITVPTPIDKYKKPLLSPLINASIDVGKVMNKNSIVIYESTVYPGATEEECVPILEKFSGLKYNKDFFVGYSPERIVPGEKEKTLTKIMKITSGSTPDIATIVDNLYKEIITAGTYKAESIKVAEAAKVIENTQRDLNIAFMNEIAQIFDILNLDTQSVLKAAGTKWNFLKFKPGLVGGHCIGVDPYYLTQKSLDSGYYPQIILSGRKLNDSMPQFITSSVIKTMISNDILIKKSNILILGFTFKENCPDFRNTRIFELYNEFNKYGLNVTVFDPYVDIKKVKIAYGLDVINNSKNIKNKFDAIILAVGHDEFKKLDFEKLRNKKSIIYDVKGFLPRNIINKRL